VAGTPGEQYHAQNSWETDHDHSDSAVHLLSVTGTPRDFSSEPSLNGSATSNDVEGPSHTRPPLGNITNNSIIPEWDGSSPDTVVKCLKALNKDQLKELGIREFYKSYGSWDKMTMEQRNKVVSYFCALPEETQGM
jgi:hypothetical protein